MKNHGALIDILKQVKLDRKHFNDILLSINVYVLFAVSLIMLRKIRY